mmetsp:Transcript_22683/g.63300  ORF Transcript_22683/g.63300 Transcript_22683/m.63300 type:complete len:212 (-) Transcript_22683:233-868(-)
MIVAKSGSSKDPPVLVLLDDRGRANGSTDQQPGESLEAGRGCPQERLVRRSLCAALNEPKAKELHGTTEFEWFCNRLVFGFGSKWFGSHQAIFSDQLLHDGFVLVILVDTFEADPVIHFAHVNIFETVWEGCSLLEKEDCDRSMCCEPCKGRFVRQTEHAVACHEFGEGMGKNGTLLLCMSIGLLVGILVVLLERFCAIHVDGDHPRVGID